MKVTATIYDLNGFVDNFDGWDARKILSYIAFHLRKNGYEVKKLQQNEKEKCE